MRKLTKEEFISKAIEIHGDRYDYSLVDYNSINNKVILICKDHGPFYQPPNSHINQKCGCPTCGKKQRVISRGSNILLFIEKARSIHGDRYDYSSVEYKDSRTKGKIICRVHGPFDQRLSDHISKKYGCPTCSSKQKYTTLSFIEKANQIHHNKYDYSLVDYKNNKTKVILICREHGSFTQLPNNHMNLKHGCSECSKLKQIGLYNNKNLYNKNGFIYLVNLYDDQESFYKIGISKNHPRKRLYDISRFYKISIIFQRDGPLDKLFDIEQHILNSFEKYIPNKKFGGHTECLTVLNTANIKQFLEAELSPFFEKALYTCC